MTSPQTKPSPLWIIGLSILFSAVHFMWYRRVIPYELWKLSGGIIDSGKTTLFGATSWAWAIPAEIAACLMMESPIRMVAQCGFLLLFIPSLLAGYLTASLVVSFITTKTLKWGRYAWKLWGLLLTCLWIPAPATWTFIYQWTVVY